MDTKDEKTVRSSSIGCCGRPARARLARSCLRYSILMVYLIDRALFLDEVVKSVYMYTEYSEVRKFRTAFAARALCCEIYRYSCVCYVIVKVVF